MNAYADTVAALADSTSEAVVALYERFAAGQLSEPIFIQLASTALSIGDARAAALADQGLAATLTSAQRNAVVVLGIPPPDPPPTLLRQLITDALTDDDPHRAVEAAARGRTLETARAAYKSGLEHHGIKQWVRVPNSGACPACQRLGGVVLPISTPMWAHKGCACTQKPATTTEKDQSDAQRSAAAQRAAATRRAANARRATKAERERQRRAAAKRDPERVARSEAAAAAARARSAAILASRGL